MRLRDRALTHFLGPVRPSLVRILHPLFIADGSPRDFLLFGKPHPRLVPHLVSCASESCS